MYGIHSTTVVGYTYDAACHCVDCAVKRWTSRMAPGDVALEDPEFCEPREIGVIFAGSEAGDSPTHCDDCNAFIDDSWTGATCDYAVDALRDYIITPGTDEGGRADVLDVWADNLTWCGKDDEQAVIIDIYFDLRHAERRDHR